MFWWRLAHSGLRDGALGLDAVQSLKFLTVIAMHPSVEVQRSRALPPATFVSGSAATRGKAAADGTAAGRYCPDPPVIRRRCPRSPSSPASAPGKRDSDVIIRQQSHLHGLATDCVALATTSPLVAWSSGAPRAAARAGARQLTRSRSINLLIPRARTLGRQGRLLLGTRLSSQCLWTPMPQ